MKGECEENGIWVFSSPARHQLEESFEQEEEGNLSVHRRTPMALPPPSFLQRPTHLPLKRFIKSSACLIMERRPLKACSMSLRVPPPGSAVIVYSSSLNSNCALSSHLRSS